ncbi:MAG: glucosaminidase domain-containing protein [Campylobacterales bacterium]|nr:glucosaminidase domain-containing protein [Campylobacterales bacterium]
MHYLSVILLLGTLVSASELPKYSAEVVPKKMSVKSKKVRFYALVNPPVQKVHAELLQLFKSVKEDIKLKRNLAKRDMLKKAYKVTTDEQLLYALKPHPQSITLAQGAMESSWGTSRFFVEAKNIFGMWSVNPKEPRIPAGVKRKNGKQVWVKKFATLEESVRAYYKTMGRAKAYRAFRLARYVTNNPYEIVPTLNTYSEMKEEYPLELAALIRYNKLQRYDK